MQRSFVLAMALDDGPSRTLDIAHRLGKEQNYVSPYRRALINADVIYSPRNSYVDFVDRDFRAFVRNEDEFVEYQTLNTTTG